MTYRNGTVAIFENGDFISYIVPPKSLFVTVTVTQNDDGSFTRSFSNGTKVWFGPPPSINETAEIRAFRIISIRFEPSGQSTYTFANGTVALFNGTIFVGYIVRPTSFFVTRKVTVFEDAGFMEEYSNGTVIRYSPPIDELADEVDRALYVVKEEINTNNGTGRSFFFNGTVILTLNGKFVRVLVPPRSLYYGCVKTDLGINGW
jgi:hypothetical protein